MNRLLVIIFFLLWGVQLSKIEAGEWQLKPNPIVSRWAKDVNPGQVLPEYPRPMLQRPDWLNLNGLWEYSILPKDQTPTVYAGPILVPFAIESALSGVQKPVGPENKLWYRRSFTIPKAWKNQTILLHFEAVDWETEVWLNKRPVGHHRGGYDPFSFDISDLLKNGANELVVAVWDPSDAGTQPRGKQVQKPNGIWYTAVTGIWQTVWLEPVPKTYITDLRLTPDLDAKTVTVRASVAYARPGAQLKLSAYDAAKVTVATAMVPVNQAAVLNLANPQLWSPNSPYLYDLTVELVRKNKKLDQVNSYFGMRKIALGKDNAGITRLMLNNQFIFQLGPLDQGFWPDGIYTAPTDAALKYDLETLKQMGFNMLRKHVKVENRRFYSWCDRIGMLVWQDMPSGDAFIGGQDPDLQRTPESAAQFELELKRLIDSHFNHPSIIMWVAFNEGWGQYDTPRIVRFIQELDPTRLVNNASGWTDRGVGDVIDIHNYPDARSPQPEPNRAAVLGEFGGLGLLVTSHTWQKENWGYQVLQTPEQLLERYRSLYNDIWRFKDQPGLSAAVYTQTTDVETETNGLMTYDREVIKMDPAALRSIHQGPSVAPHKGDNK